MELIRNTVVTLGYGGATSRVTLGYYWRNTVVALGYSIDTRIPEETPRGILMTLGYQGSHHEILY